PAQGDRLSEPRRDITTARDLRFRAVADSQQFRANAAAARTGRGLDQDGARISNGPRVDRRAAPGTRGGSRCPKRGRGGVGPPVTAGRARLLGSGPEHDLAPARSTTSRRGGDGAPPRLAYCG